jgi:hypothetical protein
MISPSGSRICLLTERDFARDVFRAGSYEGQDVLAEIDDVDLISLQSRFSYSIRQRIHKKLIWHDFTGLAYRANIAFQPTRVTKDYEIFIAHFPFINDLNHVSAVRGWKERCEHSVCWVDEFWARDVHKYKPWLVVLREFEHVIFGMSETAEVVSDVLGRKCHYVPGAVDALRFSPFPNPPNRVIDILSIGRRFEGLHHALLKEAISQKVFYVHDTFRATLAQTFDYRQHREMYANMIKRSRFALVAPGKMDSPGETKGQVAVGWRFYEAAAGGAIMLGQVPDCDTFRTMFDWPDAAIEVRPDGSNLTDVISRLTAQPERLLEMSRRNAREALLRHDWAYRWRQVLSIAGVRPRAGLEAREERLRKLAEQVGQEK